MRRALVALAALILIAGCAGGAQTPAEKQQAQKDPEPKSCSDYLSGQEVWADETNGKLSRADKKNMDSDGDGELCAEKNVKWKDPRTHVKGMPPFEVAFVADGNVQGLKTGDVTIDVSEID
jgi:hypothetical protein